MLYISSEEYFGWGLGVGVGTFVGLGLGVGVGVAVGLGVAVGTIMGVIVGATDPNTFGSFTIGQHPAITVTIAAAPIISGDL